LTANGFATMLAEDGEAAEELALTGEFDLLILDIGLPLKDGFQVLEELRSRGETLPVLVLTGLVDREAAACIDAGADDYMRKPFQFAELLSRVRARLRAGGTARVEGGVENELRRQPAEGGGA
jgi:DNA-binding response OmpR family regulator